MFFNIKNHFIIILLVQFFILTSCQLQNPDKTHGIVFLENRAKKITLNKSNKNDVIRLIGQPQLKSEIDQDSWIYLERTLTKGKIYRLGKEILKKNDVLILSFDKYGILKSKDILRKEDLKKIKFSKKTTDNVLTDKSFVQSFLESVKQKMYSNRKRR